MSSPRTLTLNTACKRCRKRKVKCDLQTPRCGNCARTGVACVSSDLTSSRAASSLPPGFLEALEVEVARLEQEATKASSQVPVLSPSERVQSDALPTQRQSSPECSHHSQAPGTNFDWSSIGEANSGALHPRFAYGMNRMIQSALAVDNTSPIHSRLPNPLLPLTRPPPASRHAHPLMESYIDTYFDTIHSCLPFLDEESVRESAGQASSEDAAASPVQLMTLSLGALLSPGGGPVPSYHSIELFMSAADDFQTLQFVLLLSLFSLFSPVGGSTWHLVGLAMQLVIALGLHQQKSVGASEKDGGANLEENAFWSAYILDRLISIPLGRPYAIHDLDIDIVPPGDGQSGVYFQDLSRLAVLSAKLNGGDPDDTNRLAPLIVIALEFDGSPDRGLTLFKTLALTLAVWAIDDAFALKRSLESNNNDARLLLDVLEAFLLHSEFQTRNNSPAPWTSAYAIFNSAVLLSAATRISQAHAKHNQAETPGHVPTPRESTFTALESCCQTFAGLNDLIPLYRKLLGVDCFPEDSARTLEVIPNRRTRAAVRMLVGLLPTAPL